jgi:hypothetical protein
MNLQRAKKAITSILYRHGLRGKRKRKRRRRRRRMI